MSTAEIEIAPPSMEEVMSGINHLKNNKAPGIDSIPSELIKCGGPAMAKKIHELLVMVWEQENIPEK